MEIGEWLVDVRKTIERLMAMKQKCDNIPRSDPPTFWEQKLIEACEFAFNAAVTVESGRLLNELRKLGEEARDSAETVFEMFMECFRDLIEPPEQAEWELYQQRKHYNNVMKSIM